MLTCRGKRQRKSFGTPLLPLRQWQRGDKLKWLREAGDANSVAHLSYTLVGFKYVVRDFNARA